MTWAIPNYCYSLFHCAHVALCISQRTKCFSERPVNTESGSLNTLMVLYMHWWLPAMPHCWHVAVMTEIIYSVVFFFKNILVTFFCLLLLQCLNGQRGETYNIFYTYIFLLNVFSDLFLYKKGFVLKLLLLLLLFFPYLSTRGPHTLYDRCVFLLHGLWMYKNGKHIDCM